MKAFLICINSIFLSVTLYAQLSVTQGGMLWTCTQEGDYLIMELRAPTTGWIGIGFNQENSILYSDLLLFHVVDGQASGTDLYVKGLGDPRPDTDLGGSHDVEIIAFEEKDQETYIKFRRPRFTSDTKDFQLKDNQSFWLILAFSTHDEFDHHSRMRKHQKVVFKLN